MNCEPFGTVVHDSLVERSCPFMLSEVSWRAKVRHPLRAPGALSAIFKAMRDDGARYMEAVRR